MQSMNARKILMKSRPSRARGLKFYIYPCRHPDMEASRPSRARGLKLLSYPGTVSIPPVAPLAGAWIEMQVTPDCPV